MARPRQPISLIEAKGKKHLTKEETAERKAQEIDAPNDGIIAPAHLTAAQKKKFRQIADELVRVGIMGNLDCDSLARYVVAEEMYRKLSRVVSRFDMDDGIIALEKAINMQDKFFKQCRACASDMGLTISSRCRLVLPKQEQKKPENKFSKFQGGAG